MRLRRIAVLILIAAFTGMLFAACASSKPNAYDLPSFDEIQYEIKAYEDSYREFVRNGEGEVMAVTSDSRTPSGYNCHSVYTLSSDGLYESCSLSVQRDFEQHDEYFNIGGGRLMFVRSYIEDNIPVIRKYICTPDLVYYVNYESGSLETVSDIGSLDIFITMDQVRTAYGKPLESTGEQASA